MATKKWQEANQEKLREYRRNWYERNKDAERLKAVIRTKQRRKNIKSKIDNVKSKGCSICNEKTICCLDFHHLKDKNIEISKMIRSGDGWSVIEEEISKCILVCANCHRKLHAGIIKLPNGD